MDSSLFCATCSTICGSVEKKCFRVERPFHLKLPLLVQLRNRRGTTISYSSIIDKTLLALLSGATDHIISHVRRLSNDDFRAQLKVDLTLPSIDSN
jgi:hypothetical protein